MPYGHMPTDDGEECGAAGRRRLRAGADPDERPLRGRPTAAATRTARSATSPTSRASSPSARLRVGLPARRALHVAPVGRARARSGLGARRLPLRRATARGDARVRVGGLPVHAVRLELELERRDHARAPDLGARLRHRRRPRAALFVGPRRLDEVRLASCSSRSGRRTRTATRWPRQQLLFVGGFLLATALGFWIAPARAGPAARRARLLGPNVRLAALAAVAVLDLGLGASTPATPTSHVLQTVLKGLLLAGAVVLCFVPRTRNLSSSPRSPARS